MLERLEVRSLGIIDRVVLEPSNGFVALTGETGAGKSLLIESLKLLAGQRAQADMVRSGDPTLRVEGWFATPDGVEARALLDEVGVPADENLVVRREIAAEGKNRAWLNDVPVTATTLQRLAPFLLAIHGQHEQYGLGDTAVQRSLVDEFADHLPLLEKVAVAYGRWEEAAAQVRALEQARARRRDRADTIAFQIGEIDAAAPQPGEDEELRRRRQVLRHAARIHELSAALLERLADGDAAAAAELARAEREAEQLAECGLAVSEVAGRLREARVLVEETVREVQGLTEGLEDGPGELEAVESRLFQLEQLMLKYGSPVAAVLEHREALMAERGQLEGLEDRLQEAVAEAGTVLGAYAEVARALDDSRRAAGDKLLAAVTDILDRLEMGGTRLELRWRERPDPTSPLRRGGVAVRFDREGVCECELLIAANPGEELRPMARIASGGELSRLHLALRTALRGRQRAAGLTLLFDEVDTGLGGGTAAALGAVLAELARVDQVLVVTHLPQVAAQADSQLRVTKVVEGGRAVTRVVVLEGEERVAELARMVAGERVESSALEHARALLRQP